MNTRRFVVLDGRTRFQQPEQITEESWTGWVQERGLYFLGERDPRYEDSNLVALEDFVPVYTRVRTGRARLGPVRQRAMGLRGTGRCGASCGWGDGAYQLLANLIIGQDMNTGIADCRFQRAD